MTTIAIITSNYKYFTDYLSILPYEKKFNHKYICISNIDDVRGTYYNDWIGIRGYRSIKNIDEIINAIELRKI